MSKYLRSVTRARKDLEFHYVKEEHAEIMGADSDNLIEKIDKILEDL